MDKMERRKVQLDATNPLISPALWPIWEKPFRFAGAAKGLRFVLELTLPLPHKVITDGTRLVPDFMEFDQQCG